jgi:hypothetical protein
MMVGLFLLSTGLVLGSSIGVATTYLTTPNDILKLLWRQMICTFAALVLGIFEFVYILAYYGKVRKFYKTSFTFESFKITFGAGICVFIWGMGLIYAANNTIQSHAYIFNNIGSVYILIGCLILGKSIHKLEIYGSGLAIVGAFLTLLDGQA